MTAGEGHAAVVDRWIARGGPQPSTDRLLQGFQRAFDVLWARAERTLSHVTLAAIVDRVLHAAREEHPLLSGISVEATGVRCDDLRARRRDLEPAELTASIRFVLVELLTIVGNLTAEILTPALHDELGNATMDVTSSDPDREDPRP